MGIVINKYCESGTGIDITPEVINTHTFTINLRQVDNRSHPNKGGLIIRHNTTRNNHRGRLVVIITTLPYGCHPSGRRRYLVRPLSLLKFLVVVTTNYPPPNEKFTLDNVK